MLLVIGTEVEANLDQVEFPDQEIELMDDKDLWKKENSIRLSKSITDLNKNWTHRRFILYDKKIYLGDGVYAGIDFTMGELVLTTENGNAITNTIVFNSEVLENFLSFVDYLKKRASDQESLVDNGDMESTS